MLRRSALFASALCLSMPALAETNPIDAARIAETVKTVSSDAFEGRAPGTPGEAKTVDYLIGRFKALGLEPGGADGGWTQKVPLLHTRLGTPAKLGTTLGGAFRPLASAKDIHLTTLQPNDRALIDGAPLVFVGYGVDAAERGWDDFKGVDLKGKVAVFLINDPDFEAVAGEDAVGRFGGRTMTYYGRWTYKFEEAARRGAVGALIVHDAPGVGYGWNVVISSGGENYGLVRPASEATSLAVQGWLSGEASTALFRDAGLDLAALRVAARRADFRPVPLAGLSFSADIPVQQEVVDSRNVLAKISGATRPDETVMLGAHWDAYGIGAPDAQGRTVRGGANDDAIGLAALLEIARAFKAGPAPARSLVFAAWTAEERGLLGSEYYAANPLYPLDRTVANLTVDVLQTAGRAKDVILVGKGQSVLEDDLARLAATQGRTVTPENLPERGLFYRADHFPFAKRGVPVLLMMSLAGASDMVAGGRAAGQRWVDDYTGKCYHQPCDAWTPEWKLDGAVMDIDLVRRLAVELAGSARWPDWKDGSEFKAVRARSAAARR